MGDRRALLARQCSSDVDLRKRVPPTETHFRVGAFERAAQFQLTRAGWGGRYAGGGADPGLDQWLRARRAAGCRPPRL